MSTLDKLISAFVSKKPPVDASVEEAHPVAGVVVPQAPAIGNNKNLDLTQRITLEGDPSSKLGRKIKPQFKPEKGLPVSQAEVDAIPERFRGTSFFTSRPVPIEALEYITIVIGNQQHLVSATKREALLYRAGNIPHVRAFMIKGKSIPWYELNRYDPYKHYWAMEEREWSPMGTTIPCLMKLENCEPSLKGYRKTA